MSPEPVVKWRSWPFMERPVTSILLVFFLCFLALIVYRITVISWQQPLYYVIGMLLVIGNLLPYFIITEYELFEEKYVVHYSFIKISRPYSDFGCYYKDKRGIMLSTFKMPRRLDAFRGQSLRFSHNREEEQELMKLLSEKIAKSY